MDRVEFLGGVMDMESFYNQLDLLVMPSRWEGFGLVAVEAMACGVPVVGSDAPGLREVLAVSSLNRRWEVGNPVHLAELIRDCAAAPLSDRQRLELRNAAERRFSLPRMVTGYERVYAEVLDRRAPLAGLGSRAVGK